MIPAREAAGETAMMGRQDRDQRQLFYEFSLDEMIPTDHLLRRINVFATAVLADLHEQLKAFYSDIGRPSIDPELMIRMLLVGYCYGIRHERRLCQEVPLHVAYRGFCKLDLGDRVPHHGTPGRGAWSKNPLHRMRLPPKLNEGYRGLGLPIRKTSQIVRKPSADWSRSR